MWKIASNTNISGLGSLGELFDVRKHYNVNAGDAPYGSYKVDTLFYQVMQGATPLRNNQFIPDANAVVMTLTFADNSKWYLKENINTGETFAYLYQAPTSVTETEAINIDKPTDEVTSEVITNDDCPCDCTKTVRLMTLYLSPIQINPTDIPIAINRYSTVCNATQPETKQTFNCETQLDNIVTKINSRLNLNGLSGYVSNVGGLRGLFGDDPCPCDCNEQRIAETWYLTDTPCPNCIPFQITETKVDCTVPPKKSEYLAPTCTELLAALKQMNPNVSMAGLKGLGGIGACSPRLHGLGDELPKQCDNYNVIGYDGSKDALIYGGAAILAGISLFMLLKK